MLLPRARQKDSVSSLPATVSYSSEIASGHSFLLDPTRGAGDCEELNPVAVLIIGCTLPITSAEAERTFSLMRRIKTFARSTMCEERFADLGVIAMNYGERITVDDVL